MGNKGNNERLRAEAEARTAEFEHRKEELRIQENLRREREWRERQEKERRIREQKIYSINKFRNEQNIADFLTLIENFLNDDDDLIYLVKTLEALNEDKLISNYKDFKDNCDKKIQIIRQSILKDEELSPNCRRKLIILLLCNQKYNGGSDQIFEELFNKDINLIFDILIDYSTIFGADISFKLKDSEIYKEFV